MSSAPKKLLALWIGVTVLWFFARYLLPIALPFLLAALLALAAEPLVFFLNVRLRLNRNAAAGIGVSMTLGILLLVLTALGALMVRQVQRLVGVVPDLGETALSGMQSLQLWLMELAESAPRAIRPAVKSSLEGLFADGSALVGQLSAKALQMASGLVTRLPDSALGVGTWLLASFMVSAKLPKIRLWIESHLPEKWATTYLPMVRRMKTSVFGWLKAQLKLIAVTFSVLTVGFWLLRITHGPVLAVLISLLDALPVLGTGTILVPWSIVSFLQGQRLQALGLLGLYAAAMLIRTALEPRLVGKQLGLDPLITLMALYAGYRLWGIAGMILAPMLAVAVSQLLRDQRA